VIRLPILASIAVALSSRPVAAQFIGGQVVDYASRQSVSGIRVVALRDTRVVAAANSDSSGNFYLGPLKAGLYRLRIGDQTPAPFLSDTVRVTDDAFVQRQFRVDTTAQRICYEFEVAKPVSGVVGSRAPRYPDELRNQRARGEVLARFVVDTTGRMVDGTFAALPPSDTRFAPAVLDALRAYVFYPAELPNGRKVRQYVHMPFQFEIR
jgi:TonB family protein